MHSSDSSMSVMPSLCINWIIYPVKCVFVNAKVIVTREFYCEFGEGPAKILVSLNISAWDLLCCAVYEDCFIDHYLFSTLCTGSQTGTKMHKHTHILILLSLGGLS